jgi:ribosomal protein L32
LLGFKAGSLLKGCGVEPAGHEELTAAFAVWVDDLPFAEMAARNKFDPDSTAGSRQTAANTAPEVQAMVKLNMRRAEWQVQQEQLQQQQQQEVQQEGSAQEGHRMGGMAAALMAMVMMHSVMRMSSNSMQHCSKQCSNKRRTFSRIWSIWTNSCSRSGNWSSQHRLCSLRQR